MDADIGDDRTKKSLFPVLELSLDSLGGDRERLFLSLVVLARGVSAPAPMLASIWDKVGLCVIKCAISLKGYEMTPTGNRESSRKAVGKQGKQRGVLGVHL